MKGEESKNDAIKNKATEMNKYKKPGIRRRLLSGKSYGPTNPCTSRSSGSSTSISGGLGLPTTADHAEFVAGDASDEDPWFVGEKKVL